MPLGSLAGSFAALPVASVPSAYAGSAIAAMGLLERAGAPRLMGLLGDLGAGADFDRAFLSWIQMPYGAFEEEWLETVHAARR